MQNINDNLSFQTENHIRNLGKLYLNMYKDKPKGFIAVAEGLASEEMEAIYKIIEFLDAPSLTNLFPKSPQITEKTNVKQLCIDSRKKCMEAVADQFTKVVLAENITNPKMKLDEIFTVVENYYDSFYLRNSKDKDLDLFPTSDKGELNKLKINSYKAIKGNVGIEAVKKDFATKKKWTFAKFCIERTKRHVTGLNQAVRNYCAAKNLEVPDKIDADYNNVSRNRISQVQNTVPTYLHMLNESYKSRSALERLFSYIPFVNKAAKEERIAINRIEDMLKNVSYLQMTSDEVESAVEKSGTDNKKDFYGEGLKEAGYKPEVVKQNVVVNEAAELTTSVNKVNEISHEMELQKHNNISK